MHPDDSQCAICSRIGSSIFPTNSLYLVVNDSSQSSWLLDLMIVLDGCLGSDKRSMPSKILFNFFTCSLAAKPSAKVLMLKMDELVPLARSNGPSDRSRNDSTFSNFG